MPIRLRSSGHHAPERQPSSGVGSVGRRPCSWPQATALSAAQTNTSEISRQGKPGSGHGGSRRWRSWERAISPLLLGAAPYLGGCKANVLQRLPSWREDAQAPRRQEGVTEVRRDPPWRRPLRNRHEKAPRPTEALLGHVPRQLAPLELRPFSQKRGVL